MRFTGDQTNFAFVTMRNETDAAVLVQQSKHIKIGNSWPGIEFSKNEVAPAGANSSSSSASASVQHEQQQKDDDNSNSMQVAYVSESGGRTRSVSADSHEKRARNASGF